MRFLPLALVLPLVLPLTCAAQVPLIGTLDLYGVRKVSESRIRQTLGVKPGDPLPPSKGDTEERLDAIPGVVESHLEAVCCDQGKVILYVGIEERGAAHFDIRDNRRKSPALTRNFRLPWKPPFAVAPLRKI